MKLYKTEGIILKRKNYQESDRMLTILTREFGKVKVIGKGVRKISSRRAGHLEIFTHAQFTLYRGKTFDYVTEVAAINQHEAFRRDLGKSSFAYYVCELVDFLLPDGQEHPEVYDRMLKSFSVLCTSEREEVRHKEVYGFALDTLWFLGFLPPSQTILPDSIHGFIESVIERKLKTVKLMEMT